MLPRFAAIPSPIGAAHNHTVLWSDRCLSLTDDWVATDIWGEVTGWGSTDIWSRKMALFRLAGEVWLMVEVRQMMGRWPSVQWQLIIIIMIMWNMLNCVEQMQIQIYKTHGYKTPITGIQTIMLKHPAKQLKKKKIMAEESMQSMPLAYSSPRQSEFQTLSHQRVRT